MYISFVTFGRFFVLVSLIFVLTIGCGGEKTPPKSLTVKVIDTGGLIREEVFPQIAQQFASTQPGLIVCCTPETVSPDIRTDELSAIFGKGDVVIFPSMLNEKLRTQSNLFYPVQGLNLSLPPVLDLAYAGATESSQWAAPLLVDPMMMFVKKGGQDDTYIPRDWQTIYMRATMMDRPLPYFVFLTGDPLGLADSIALQQFSVGYQTEMLHHTQPEQGVTEEDKRVTYAAALANMKVFITGSVEKRMEQIPQVSNLETFFASGAYVTFARYSAYMRLPETSRALLEPLMAPQSYGPVAPCYAIAAGIPIQSANPSLGEEFIRYLLSQIDQIAGKQNYLVAQLPAETEKGIGIFPRNTVFVIREGMGALSEKVVIDAINGDLGIEDLNQLWRTTFFLPSANL